MSNAPYSCYAFFGVGEYLKELALALNVASVPATFPPTPPAA